MLTKYTDPIVTTYRYKPDGEKVTIPIEEKLEVTNGIVFLKEIPDKNLRVMIDGKIEVYKPEDLDSESKFYVDYNTGVIFVQKSLNGKKLSINYSGIGVTYYPASRIYLKVDENHNVTRTLADIENQISDLSTLNSEQERLKQEIEKRNQEISKTLEEVKNVDLSESIAEASKTKKSLEDSTHNAKSTDATLKASIEFSEGVRVDLAKKNELAQKNIDSLEKANTSSESKTQTLNESIEKATKTNESLKATDSSITSSLSTYETKSEELKASIEQVDFKKTALNDIIEKSNTADSKLKETTKLANESNENLKTTNQKATEINQSLKTENEKAEQTTTTLSSKIDSGLNVKIGLDDSIAKGKQTKLELDDSNAKATETNTTLKDTTEKAKKEKGDLTTIVTSGQEVAKELSERNQSANVNIEDLKRENKKAIDNTSGLQVETQNALTKQQTLSEETTKAQQAIEKITELLTSSTDLKTKLEQIIANGDLDKYVTDPKLKEILTAYATKDDLSKIDVTSQLVEYAKKTDLEKIDITSQLKLENCTFKIIQEKEDFNNVHLEPNKINFVNLAKSKRFGEPKNTPDGAGVYITARNSTNMGLSFRQVAINLQSKKIYERLATEEHIDPRSKKQVPREYEKWEEYGIQNANMADLELKADKSDIPSLLSQLTNDTKFKTETEIQEMIAKSSSFKKEVVDALPSSGEENVFYLVKDDKGKDGNSYLEYLWISGKWELIGSTQVDLSRYATKNEIPNKISQLDNDKSFVSMESVANKITTYLNAFNENFSYTFKGLKSINGNISLNSTALKQGIVYVIPRRTNSENAKSYPNNIPTECFLITLVVKLNQSNSPDDVNPPSNSGKAIQFCIVSKDLKVYKRESIQLNSRQDGYFLCEWNDWQEIKPQSTAPDLSPFTQQELEEAFK